MSLLLFKQKTAYEMRISDWSSDVCVSDLARRIRLSRLGRADAAAAGLRPGVNRLPARAVCPIALNCACKIPARARLSPLPAELSLGKVACRWRCGREIGRAHV